MNMRRTWAVYTFAHDYPVLIERCATQAGALKVAELRSQSDGGHYAVIEQLLPVNALLTWVAARVQASPGGR